MSTSLLTSVSFKGYCSAASLMLLLFTLYSIYTSEGSIYLTAKVIGDFVDEDFTSKKIVNWTVYTAVQKSSTCVFILLLP